MLIIHLNLFGHGTNATIGPEFSNLAWLGGSEGPLISFPSSERQEVVMRSVGKQEFKHAM